MKLRVLAADEVAEHDKWLAQQSVIWAWHEWILASCEERGGHWWRLTIDPDDGVYLECQHCPAGVNDLYPDGQDLLAGEFEVVPGYVLGLDCGDVTVNGKKIEPWDFGPCIAYGWKGPVTVNVRTEVYRNWEYPDEYDVWIDLEPA